ncbi:MAG: hypothetical protein ISR84_00200 [Kiritimatiellales bacterium]|nr:hypothetical protein [Kiritimatiellota bacterium]MBL7015956.1 hypothetical protein [Kiritimatiellales bacterium]
MNITEAGSTLVLSDTTPEEKKRILSAIKQPAEGKPRLLTRKQVADILCLHSGSIKRYDGKLLHPVKITPRTVRYPAEQVEALLAQRGVA